MPVEYAARTIALPPVASTSETPGWFMSSEVAWIEGCSIHWTQSAGAPASMAASRTIFAAAIEHCWALGWKPKMIGLRVLMAMRP